MFRRFICVTLLIVSLTPSASFAATKKTTSCTHSAKKGAVTCYARLKVDGSGHPLVSAGPSGFGPADFRRAYGGGGGSARIAIVVAYGDTSLAADLATFSSAFGLSGLPTCITASQGACLDLRDQNGAVGVPGGSASWAVETALDAETVHGLCPGCRLEVVAASTSTTNDLLAAVAEANRLGAAIVSMSWGGAESASERTNDSYFTRAGTTYIASSGDNGYGVSWPAASPDVVAVGGTTLRLAGGRAETAWSGSGSGCSKYEPRPSWQNAAGCAHRSVADLAADADPNTGAAIYRGAWYTVGGTSLAAPLVAGLAAARGGIAASRLYGAGNGLRDITGGSNGHCAAKALELCQPGVGYDGPTGNGSPLAPSLWR